MRNRHEDREPGIWVVADRDQYFQSHRWREAFKTWQDKVWSREFRRLSVGDQSAAINIITEQQGVCGNSSLNIYFDGALCRYSATAICEDLALSDIEEEKILRPEGNTHFEIALARFVRDRRWRALNFRLTDPRHVRDLVLVNNRGHLQIGASR